MKENKIRRERKNFFISLFLSLFTSSISLSFLFSWGKRNGCRLSFLSMNVKRWVQRSDCKKWLRGLLRPVKEIFSTRYNGLRVTDGVKIKRKKISSRGYVRSMYICQKWRSWRRYSLSSSAHEFYTFSMGARFSIVASTPLYVPLLSRTHIYITHLQIHIYRYASRYTSKNVFSGRTRCNSKWFNFA